MKICRTLIALSMLTVSAGPYLHAQEVTVNGQINVEKPYLKPETVQLFSVRDGLLEQIAESPLDERDSFTFTFHPPYKGFYVVGWGNPRSPEYKHKLYFEGGETLDALFGAKGYELQGNTNSAENVLLSQWAEVSSDVMSKAVYGPRETFRTFFPRITDFAKQNMNWYSGRETGNAEFDQLMSRAVPYDIVSWAMIFMTMPNSEHPKEEDYRGSFYADIDPVDYLADTTLLSMPFGNRMLNGLLMLPTRLGFREGYADVDDNLKAIKDAKLKSVYLMGRANSMRSLVDIDEFMSRYGEYLSENDIALLEEQKARFRDQDAKMSGIDFRFTDLSGKEVSLSDFKGKVVYLDIWATWCAPCRAEFPHLKAIEERYHGNDNIVFIGVSIDKPEHRPKWEQMVKDEGLPGIQLFAGGPDKMPAEYNISGIPRFILFGRDGKVVAGHAPRPSSGSLEELIDRVTK